LLDQFNSVDEGSSFVNALVYDTHNPNKVLTTQIVQQDIFMMLSRFGRASFAEEVAEFYTITRFAHKEPTQDDFRIAISHAFGDFLFDCPEVLMAEEMAQHSPSNHYYSYRLTKAFKANPGWAGVTHGDDVHFLTSHDLDGTTPESQLSRDMLHAWTQFAKTGSPGEMSSVKWEEAFDRASTHKETRLMRLHAPDYAMVEGYYRETCNTFWKPRIWV